MLGCARRKQLYLGCHCQKVSLWHCRRMTVCRY